MLEFHTLCILQQTLRCREYFCLMKPLIRPCRFTSNLLTFKTPPHIRTLMRTTVHLTPYFENQYPSDILSHHTLPSLTVKVVSVISNGGFSTAPHFKHQGFK